MSIERDVRAADGRAAAGRAAAGRVAAGSTAAGSTLRGLCGGAVWLPGDDGYDAACTPWNVAVGQRPAAVARPQSAAAAADVVRAAAAAGLRVAPQGTGHNPGPLGPLGDAVLLRTSAMTGVRVDPDACRATVAAGVLWQDAVAAAAPHGLAALHGSSPDVGVVGYSLGGGMGWYSRALGLQANSVTAAEVITADGTLVRADAATEPDLFWALRGGGGNFGVVTALEFALHPVESAFAGLLAWDWKHAPRVLGRWVDWAQGAPEEVTTSLRLLQLPPIPEIPEPLRNRQLVVIDGAVLSSDEEAGRILAPLRELAPEMDTFARVPASSLVRLHMDPEAPSPSVSDSAMLGALDADGVDALLSAAGPGSGTSLLIAAELRQIGGALGRPQPGAGALPMLDGQFVLFSCTIAGTPEAAAQGLADARRTVETMAPWSSGRQYLNFAERPVDPRGAYSDSAWRRLQSVRAAVDPAGVFMANHEVPSAA